MNSKTKQVFKILATTILVLLAALVLWKLWIYYKVDPWTRDGRVRADTVQISPDVSGLITDVPIKDNQVVKAGDVLFVIDRERFAFALKQAMATITNLQVQLAQMNREDKRDHALKDLVSDEIREQSRSKIDSLKAAMDQAEAAEGVAKLNMERAEVKAPVNGIITNFELHPGDYATAGRAVFAIIDSDSIHIVGYFEETKIDRIAVSDRAIVRLMGDSLSFNGHVESIAGGIEDRDRSDSPRLLANVTPTFNWVRLAQRIPVRIKIDAPPETIKLISGRTATVQIQTEVTDGASRSTVP